jgi:predicted PurR-regulated permease PerM
MRAREMAELELRVPFATLIKIAFAILIVLIVMKLWPLIVMMMFAIFLAVMLDPIAGWLEAHGARRAFAIGGVAFVLFALLVGFLIFLVPVTTREAADLGRQLPQLEQRLTARYPPLGRVVETIRSSSPQLRVWLTRGVVAGKYVIEGTTALVFVLVVAIYLLIEGRRAFSWLVSFAQPKTRDKLNRTGKEASGVVLAFVRGSVIRAGIHAVFSLVLLLILRVPAAVPLAMLAFLCDFVPVVGTLVMMVPAAALALTVSPARALIVVAAYIAFHAIENYYITPRIYGDQMQLSTLTVLLAFAAGAMLQGVAGAVLILPIVAAYPIVERIWLREQLPRDTVTVHERMAR